MVRGRHSRRHCYHLFHLFLFSFSKVHRHLLSSEALKAYSLPVRRANKKRRNKKRSLEGRGYGICRWRGLSKNLRYDWFGFSHTCFPGISGRFLFLHTKKFHISNYYYFYDNSLECIHSLQGSLLQIFALQVSPLTCPLSKCFSLQNVSPNSTISCDPWSSLTRLTEWNRFQSRTILPLGGNARGLGRKQRAPRVRGSSLKDSHWRGVAALSLGFSGPLDRCHTTN